MKAKEGIKPLLVIMIWAFTLWGSQASAQTVQPGNPTSPSLPPKYPGDGTTDTKVTKVRPLTLPSGWATTEDGNGCQWAVPGGWYFVQHNVDSLRAGGGSGKALLQGVGFNGDWDKYKKQKKQQFHATKILEDSPERLWLQYSKQNGGLHYFVAIVGTLFVCSAHIDIPNKTELKDMQPVADQMAISVRPSSP